MKRYRRCRMTRPDEPDRPEWLEAVPADQPPAGFADRVVKAWQRESAAEKEKVVSGMLPGRSRRLMPLAAGAIAAAAVGILAVIALQPDKPQETPPAANLVLPFPSIEPTRPDAGDRELYPFSTCSRLAVDKKLWPAKACLERFLTGAPQDAQAHLTLGIVNARLGQREESAYHYEKYLELDPNGSQAPQIANILKQYREWKSEIPPEEKADPGARPDVEAFYRAREHYEEADKLLKDDPEKALYNLYLASDLLGKDEPYQQKIESLKSAVLEVILNGVDTKENDSVLRAKRLYEVAYVIKGTNPQGALDRLYEARALLPSAGASADIYRKKIDRLIARLEALGEDGELPVTSPPPRIGPADGTTGALSNSDIARTMMKHLPAMQGCVRQQKQRDPTVTGTMLVSFTIQPSGTVKGRVKILSVEHRGTYLAGCITYIIKHTEFPEFEGDPVVVPRLPIRLVP